MYIGIENYDGQNANNLMQMPKGACCETAFDDCQYDVIIPTANAVNNIIFLDPEGVSKTVTFSPAVTGAADVIQAIKDALSANGYYEDGNGAAGVSSTTSGTNTIYHISGQIEVVSMLHNTSTTVTATQRCDAVQYCEHFFEWAGDAGTTTFTVDGVDATLGAFTLAGNTAAQVQAAIIALANWPATAYINVVETATAFEITITDRFDRTFILDGNTFTESNCAPMYQA